MNPELWQKYVAATAAAKAAKARHEAAKKAEEEALFAKYEAETGVSNARFELLRQAGGEHDPMGGSVTVRNADGSGITVADGKVTLHGREVRVVESDATKENQ
jgi:hypothetical protein